MTISTLFPFKLGTSFPYSHYKTDVNVIARATEIAKSTKSLTRTEPMIFIDAVNGLSLELALKNYLIDICGYQITDHNNLLYDILVDVRGELYHIDVKGRFSESAKTYCQSHWEFINSSNLNSEIFYMCFDCTDGYSAKYEGWTLSRKFKQSKYNSSRYIYPEHLFKE